MIKYALDLFLFLFSFNILIKNRSRVIVPIINDLHITFLSQDRVFTFFTLCVKFSIKDTLINYLEKFSAIFFQSIYSKFLNTYRSLDKGDAHGSIGNNSYPHISIFIILKFTAPLGFHLKDYTFYDRFFTFFFSLLKFPCLYMFRMLLISSLFCGGLQYTIYLFSRSKLTRFHLIFKPFILYFTLSLLVCISQYI